MNNIYCCQYSQKNFLNILEYCTHINSYNKSCFNFLILKQVLEYLIKCNIEPEQDKLDYDIMDDGDIICYAINEIDKENIAVDLLNLITEKNWSSKYEVDDEDKLKEHLFNKGYICNYNYDLFKVSEKFNSDEWENFCHYTNNDILMLCIKKGWRNFCLKLLDLDVPYNVNKQNITNSYKMAIKYNMLDVAE